MVNLKRQVDSIKTISLQRLRHAANVIEDKTKVEENEAIVKGNEINAAQSRIKVLERSLKLSEKRYYQEVISILCLRQ